MSTPLLEIKNLKVSFDTKEGIVHAVNDLSFTINKGETIGIVGESGSGKSVTALSIMRLLPTEGKISGNVIYQTPNNDSINLTDLPLSEMQKFRGNDIAMIFQEPMTSLNPVFSCGKQVAEAIILHKKISSTEARERTIALFEKVKLPRSVQMFDSFPHQLSGGQKQRVMIAMAMSCNPSVLIADEPTTALDVTVQATILELMRMLQEENNTGLLFITHDLGVVAEIADRVMVMYKGKIVEEGNVRDVFYRPQHPYTKGLLACRPPLNKRLRILPTVRDFMKENEDGTITEINSSVINPENEISKEVTKLLHEKLFSQTPILQVKNISVKFPIRKGVFGKVTDYVNAVDDISFDVYPGETLGLVGESGCGKTTLGRAIIRLIEPTSGKVYFKGFDFSSLYGRELRRMRKHIQIIFQDPYSSLNPRMTIGRAIMEPMQVHKLHNNDTDRKRKVIELLERVNSASFFLISVVGRVNQMPKQTVATTATMTATILFHRVASEAPSSAYSILDGFVFCEGFSAWAISASRNLAIVTASGNRSLGCFDNSFNMNRSSQTGTVGTCSQIDRGCSCTMRCIDPYIDSLRNGECPVHIAYMTDPRLNKSDLAVQVSPRTCSGAMN